MKMENTNRRLLLAVAFDDVNETYTVDVPKGSNVAETAFAMAVVIKCLVRDNVIDDHTVMTELLNKYLTESQYNEVS